MTTLAIDKREMKNAVYKEIWQQRCNNCLATFTDRKQNKGSI